jgi:hypothetical protein
VLDQHLPWPEEEPDKEEAEHKATCLDEMRGLQAATKYIPRTIHL